MAVDWGELYRTALPDLVRFLHRKVWDMERARDLAQDTFVRALQENPANPRAWLFTVAANLALALSRSGYRVGVPEGGCWVEVLNTDASLYGGSNCGNAGGLEAKGYSTHGRPATLELTLPPLGVVVLKRQG